LSLDLRSAGSNPAQDDGFLRAIKICSTPSFIEEVKPAVHILRRVEDPYSMKEIIVGRIH
jgi:hypothetical protein